MDYSFYHVYLCIIDCILYLKLSKDNVNYRLRFKFVCTVDESEVIDKLVVKLVS